MSEWKKVKFLDLFSEPTKNGIYKSKEYHGRGAKIINMGEVFAYSFIGNQEMSRVEISDKERDSFLVKNGDLLFARRSLVESGAGKCAIANGITEETTFESSIIRVRLNENYSVPLFYMYWMRSLSGRTAINGIVNGVNVKGIRATDLQNIEVDHPPFSTQKSIATILSRYDTLIENYQKQIKLLEEAAQRLYKEWFVELRFPGHENTKMVDGLPEGWEKKKLGELVTKSIGGGWGKESPQEKYDKEGFVIRGTDISKLRCGNLDDIPFRYHTESNLKERTLSDGDLIFEVSGGSEKEPVGRMYLITQQILDFYKKDVICASFCKKVAFSNKCTSILCYFAMQYCRISGDMKKYEKDSAGNIINFAWTTFLEDFFVLLPNDEILEAFYKTAIDIINKQVNLALQIRLLTEARDRLLPRLMGGEMEVDAPKGQRAINPVHRSGRPEGAKK